MEHRVTILEERVKVLTQFHEEIRPKIQEFDTACEVNAPLAQSAHKATAELSKSVSDLQTGLSTIIKELDRTDEERKERDIRDQLFKDSTTDAFNAIRRTLADVKEFIAEEKGKDVGEDKGRFGRNTLVSFIVTSVLLYSAWIGANSFNNTVAIADIKAVKKDNSVKIKKKKEDK